MNKSDSNTNYVPVNQVFNIRKFYDENYTEYCASFGPKIVLLFDLLAGDAYERAMEMKVVDDSTIEFKGSAYSIQKMYGKLMNNAGMKVVACNMSKTEKVNGQKVKTPLAEYTDIVPEWITNPIDRFIREKGTCIIKDTSSYSIQFKLVA